MGYHRRHRHSWHDFIVRAALFLNFKIVFQAEPCLPAAGRRSFARKQSERSKFSEENYARSARNIILVIHNT